MLANEGPIMRTTQRVLSKGDDKQVLLAKLYSDLGVPLDKLPYTTEFDRLQAEFCAQGKIAITARQLWRELISLRKTGLLPRLRTVRGVVNGDQNGTGGVAP